MIIADETINHRRIFARLKESEIHDILIKAVAEKAGFEVDLKETDIKVIISKVDKGAKGFESYAEITLINDL